MTKVLHLRPGPSTSPAVASYPITQTGSANSSSSSSNNHNNLRNFQSNKNDYNNDPIGIRNPSSATSNTATKGEGVEEGADEGNQRFQFIPRTKRRRRTNGGGRPNNGNATVMPLNLTGTRWELEESAPMPNVSNLLYYRNLTTEGGAAGALVPNLWDDDPALPQWMKDYLTWHQWKRRHWGDLKHWKSERWLVMQCLMDQDAKKCGGTSDRLKSFPVLLKIAYQSKRILLIRWTRPAPLEEFLLPPLGGLDWRVPNNTHLMEAIHNISNGKRVSPIKLIKPYSVRGVSMLRTRYQTSSAHKVYNDLVVESGEPTFNTVFPHVWRYFFTPSPPVAAAIRSKLDAHGLVPNGYVAAHLRALYAVEGTEDQPPERYIQMFAENALACATELRPGVPIFFASDSAEATAHAVAIGTGVVPPKDYVTGQGSQRRTEVAVPPVYSSVPDPNPPWHLDMYLGPPFKFYDTFVDLYLMALAGCVTYNKGGYGHWAVLIGGNLNCSLEQETMGRGRSISKPCHFRGYKGEASAAVATFGTVEQSSTRIWTKPLLLPPMDE
jgi:hypothetical protein